MFVRTCYTVAIWSLIHSTASQRRIHNGVMVSKEMPFAVYLLKASTSERKYKGWTCGGALVSKDFVITSAACVEDVKHLYVIAGYSKFVDADDIDNDVCTKNRKKKVVFTCVPKAYEFEFTRIEQWAVSDLAVVKVESPYDLNDQSYKTDCSYTPAIISINYEKKYQEPGIEAVVLGWGHLKEWRPQTDLTSYNVEQLHYAPTTISNKTVCKNAYRSEKETEGNNKLLRSIDKYMICTLHAGNLDDKGELLKPSDPVLDGCDSNQDGGNPKTLKESEDSIEIPDKFNENSEDTVELERRKSEVVVVDRRRNNMTITGSRRSRRNGICQNDHGGPLVTWVGGHEVLIGVASVFKIINSTCAGPYLFTSTQCNGRFIDCVLNSDAKNTSQRRSCDDPPSKSGYEMIERRISWIGHPDGPAANEVIKTRPQVPINQYYRDRS